MPHTKTAEAAVAIQVALPAEANILVQHWDLQRLATASPMATSFSCYKHPHRSLYLVVTGVGTISAACGMQVLASQLPHTACSTWLNLGLCGHGTADIGSVWSVDQVLDVATGACYYPGGVAESHLQHAILHTVARYHPQYPDQALVDMEGAGFCKAAQLLMIPREQIEICKIVSDNSLHPVADNKRFNRQQIDAWFQAALPAIDALVASLYALSVSEVQQFNAYYPDISYCTQRWHITHYQQHQLQGLLRRVHALHGKDVADSIIQQPHTRSRDLIAALQCQLESNVDA